MHDQLQVRRVTVDQVPRVGSKLVMDMLDESWGAKQIQRLLASEAHAQQLVEAVEVIHMCVRHEYLRHPQQRTRRQSMQISKVDQQRPLLEQEFDIETRIAKWVVD